MTAFDIVVPSVALAIAMVLAKLLERFQRNDKPENGTAELMRDGMEIHAQAVRPARAHSR